MVLPTTGSRSARAGDSKELMTRDAEVEPALDDTALVRAAQRGDHEAFGVLVSRHASSILSLTTRMLGPAGDAAYKALPDFRFISKFSTWLYRIAANKCTDSLRSRRPENVSLDATGDE